jgi:hypothetical protein
VQNEGAIGYIEECVVMSKCDSSATVVAEFEKYGFQSIQKGFGTNSLNIVHLFSCYTCSATTERPFFFGKFAANGDFETIEKFKGNRAATATYIATNDNPTENVKCIDIY